MSTDRDPLMAETKLELVARVRRQVAELEALRNERTVLNGMLTMSRMTNDALSLVVAKRSERISELERELEFIISG